MIPRYVLAEMGEVWSEASRFGLMLRIEVLALEARANLGQVPRTAFDAFARLIDRPIRIERIRELEKATRHETVAFLQYLSECAGKEHSPHLHLGMTSNDVLDTCLNKQLVQAADIIIRDLRSLLKCLRRRAFEFREQLCMGRSHGIHAEPTTFGLKLAFAHAEFERALKRVASARHEVATGAVSGPVGTFATVPPEVEAHVCEGLGLRVESVSTQVIPRDRHAQYFATLAVVASSVERLATEIRNLQRSEILEVEEPFRDRQKGSSAMPHKRNPILSENLVGLARIVRAAVMPALEDVALWHERDMSHSSVERVIAPDATTALDFALSRLTSVIEGMQVRPRNMARNLSLLKGLHNSHRVLDALVRAGLERDLAHDVVQRVAMVALDNDQEFQSTLAAEAVVREWLSDSELDSLFDDRFFAAHVDTIFERVFGGATGAEHEVG